MRDLLFQIYLSYLLRSIFFGLTVSQAGEAPDPSLKRVQHFFDYKQLFYNLLTTFFNMNRLGKLLTLPYSIFWTDSQSGGGSPCPFPTIFFLILIAWGTPWPSPTTFFDYEQVGEAPDPFLQHFLDWPSVRLGKRLTLPYNIFLTMNRFGKPLTLPYNIFSMNSMNRLGEAPDPSLHHFFYN